MTHNKESLMRHTRRLMSHKPDLVLLPEVCLGGFAAKTPLKEVFTAYKELLNELKLLSLQNGVSFYGSAITKSGKKIFNTAFFITAGEIKNTYNKLHLFRFNNEHKTFAAGKSVKVFETPWGKIAPLICYDLRFPELARSQTRRGAQMALVCAQWPDVRRDHWLTLIKARAIENQIFVLAVNRTGITKPLGAQKKWLKNKAISFAGDSCVVSPWGEVLFSMGRRRQLGIYDLDLSALNVRKHFPFLKDIRRELF